MAEKKKKTGVTELAILTTLASVFEVGQKALTDNPIVPDPWGPVVVGTLALLTLLARTLANAKEGSGGPQ